MIEHNIIFEMYTHNAAGNARGGDHLNSSPLGHKGGETSK